jgi:predicted Fe-Mo cluster-binding NifX family protein
MKIAVTSQNRRIITEHAGRCRKFWVFTIEGGRIINKELLELPKELSFHESHGQQAHPLDGIDVLIAGGMGEGLVKRLERKGIKGLVTKETDPERAVSLYLEGKLAGEAPHPPHDGHHEG